MSGSNNWQGSPRSGKMLRDLYRQASTQLAALPDVDEPNLEAEVLLRQALKISRADFFLNLEKPLAAQEKKTFQRLLERRLTGEPTAYIIGCREFYGLDFYVDRRALIPRPETEILVEEALKIAPRFGGKPTIVDIATGSGAVAVSLAIHLPEATFFATDVSAEALEVAAFNCRKHDVAERVRLLQGDLTAPIVEAVDILTANLPYVPTAEMHAMPSARFEPVQALDGGEQGLDQIFRLIRQLDGKVKPHGYALLEVGFGQAHAVSVFAHDVIPGVDASVHKDLAGIERVITLHF